MAERIEVRTERKRSVHMCCDMFQPKEYHVGVPIREGTPIYALCAAGVQRRLVPTCALRVRQVHAKRANMGAVYATDNHWAGDRVPVDWITEKIAQGSAACFRSAQSSAVCFQGAQSARSLLTKRAHRINVINLYAKCAEYFRVRYLRRGAQRA